MKSVVYLLTAVAAAAMLWTPAAAQTDSTVYYHVSDSARSGMLISSSTAMETAWDLVLDPYADSIGGGAERAALVRRGFSIFTQTKKYAPQFSGNALSCSHCHVNAGQREKALPLVGIANVFPEFNKRAGREFTLADRITGCFLRSMNAVSAPVMMTAHGNVAGDARSHDGEGMQDTAGPGPAAAVIAGSVEVRALAEYIGWLSEGYPAGTKLTWRGRNKIPDSLLVPVAGLDPARGRTLFLDKCVTCHGEDGQGVEIGDIKPGPLWGPGSWNDGAGAARVYTLAGMVRYMMPYLDPGSLTDEEALQIARFICSQPRPDYPFKSLDYLKGSVPTDAVYYRAGK